MAIGYIPRGFEAEAFTGRTHIVNQQLQSTEGTL